MLMLPAPLGGKEGAPERSQHAASLGDGADQAEGEAATLLPEEIADDGHRYGDERTAADRLDEACADEDVERR